jgi:hypothetical protein
MTTTRAEASCATVCRASSKALSISLDSALKLSGRLSTKRITPTAGDSLKTQSFMVYLLL